MLPLLVSLVMECLPQANLVMEHHPLDNLDMACPLLANRVTEHHMECHHLVQVTPVVTLQVVVRIPVVPQGILTLVDLNK